MSDKIKNRTSRESEVRNKDLRKKPWTPPSSLDAPPAPAGFCHRWIRIETMGFQDTANVSKALREGWEFVRSEEIKNTLGDHDYPVIHDGKYAGLIGVGGLVLARIPEEIMKSRAEYFQKITQDRMTSIDNDLMKEQRPGMPINIDRQSRVTFGGGRKS
jgi:hypothetical protein